MKMTKIDEMTRNAVLACKDFHSNKTTVIRYPGYCVMRYNGDLILEYYPWASRILVYVPNVRNRTAILNRINAVLDNFDMCVTGASLTVWSLMRGCEELGRLRLDNWHTINLKTKELTKYDYHVCP